MGRAAGASVSVRSRSAASAKARPSTRLVRLKCWDCGKDFKRHAKEGYTVSCPHCGARNPGPELSAKMTAKLLAQQQTSPPKTRRARPAAAPVVPGRGATAPRPPVIEGGARQAPKPRTTSAPKSRTTSAKPLTPAKPTTPTPQRPPAAPSPPQRPRRGFFDQLMYGADA